MDIQREILELVFKEVARREGRAWLGPKRSQNGKTNSAPNLIAQLRSWDLPLEEKTISRLTGVGDVRTLLESFLLKGVRLDSHMGLWGLVSGAYPLKLRRDIPTPAEMLDRQCEGERYVTLLTADVPIGRFKDRFEFLMHDLEHAHKFFGDPDLFRAQVKFFNLLRESLPQLEHWRGDPLFEKDLNYLMSDMNSHPVHLFKYMKAIVLTAELRRGNHGELDDFWRDLLGRWPEPNSILPAGLKINRPGLESSEDQIQIHDYFTKGTKIC